MLIRLDIFATMNMPYFMIGYSPNSQQFTGEDIFFCRKARATGFDVLIDHDLSRELGHVGELEFRHEHANLNLEEAQNVDNKLQST